MLDLALEVGVLDPVVQAATLQRIVHIAGAVRGQHHDRRSRGREPAEFGNGDLVVGQHFQQVRLELVVGAIDLVDQQHRWHLADVVDGLQQRTLQQEPFVVQLLLERAGADAQAPRRWPRRRAGAAVGGSSPSRTRPGTTSMPS